MNSTITEIFDGTYVKEAFAEKCPFIFRGGGYDESVSEWHLLPDFSRTPIREI